MGKAPGIMTPDHFPCWEYQEDLLDLSTDSLILLASSVDGSFKLNRGSSEAQHLLPLVWQFSKTLGADPCHHIHTHTKEKMDRNLKYYHKQNQGENIPLHFVFIQEGILCHHDFFSLSVCV